MANRHSQIAWNISVDDDLIEVVFTENTAWIENICECNTLDPAVILETAEEIFRTEGREAALSYLNTILERHTRK